MARLFPLLLVLLYAATASAQINCAQKLSSSERQICATPELLQLDRWLGTSYRAAMTAPSASATVKTGQRAWLRERDKCDRYDCLKSLYRSRIAELTRLAGQTLSLASVRPTRDEVAKVCVALAHQIDHQSIDDALIPVELTHPKDALARGVTRDEGAKLPATGELPDRDASEPVKLYELMFQHSGPPVRLGIFPGTYDCRSRRIFNLEGYLTGVANLRKTAPVIDLETRIAVSTAEDRLFASGGRFFVYTGSPQAPRPRDDSPFWIGKQRYLSRIEGSASVVSWVAPDGEVQPVCVLRTKAKAVLPRSSADQEICEARTSGRLPFAQWQKNVFDPDNCCPNPLASDDGSSPAVADAIVMGDDANDDPFVMVRLAYEPNHTCGSVRAGSFTLSLNFWDVAKTDLMDLVQPGVAGKAVWPEVYQLGDRMFVEVGNRSDSYELLEVSRGSLRRVCEYQLETSTEIAQRFDPVD